ncbi:sigma-54-dependent Fis family transcriptional regulator [Alkalicoccus daliensis]|uniref:sigma-54-dependent Fis family transcriptional regulator n=1 Tax=Alkalicoccus daliensis TaxID=745820 RepID=UPI00158624F5|nr:sigma-54-dependent Fis family transcriptional regulator [Alkalicoccus daliensis]
MLKNKTCIIIIQVVIFVKVLVIAPYKGLAELIRNMQPKLNGFQLIIHEADLDQGLELINFYEEQGESFDFIISRGGTAKVIRAHSDIPVVGIKISGYDILRILTLLKSYNTRIGMVGFRDIIFSFESISNVINIDIDYKIIQDESEVKDTLLKLKQENVQIIVGDAVTVRLAGEFGMQGVLITSGEESVREAFENAERMYAEIQRFRSNATIYENLINRIEDGICLVDEAGSIKYYNSVFSRFMYFSSLKEKKSLFTEHSYFKTIIEEQVASQLIHFQLATNQFGKVINVQSGRINSPEAQTLHYIQLKKVTGKKEPGITFTFSHSEMENTPQYIMSEDIYRNAEITAHKLMQDNKPVTIIGEEGTGKRMFVNLFSKRENFDLSRVIEIEIEQADTKKFNKLLELVKKESKKSVIHLRGINQTSKAQQNKLLESLKEVKAQLIFSLIGDLQDMEENKWRLEKELLLLLSEDPIYFPPLRHREESLEGIINTFILKFNEEFGKQVVGIEPDSLKNLLDCSWEGNITELRNTIRKLVRNSQSTYLEFTKEEINENGNKDNMDKYIYLEPKQTLEELEDKIIQKVLKEENGNQSKTAKRLGITRSTLWRKMGKQK